MTEPDNDARQPPQLVSMELRVLGALMEKQLTTPDQYPLTLNSIITACNQKSNREPVTNYSQGDIARTLQELQHRQLVNKEYGSRSDKFSQHFIKHLELGKKHQALLCVMMLRGPQTLSELNTRTQRMVDFTGKEDLEHTVDRLCDREVPFVVRLSQQPGQRGERFAHLFSGAPGRSASSYTDTPVTTGSSAPPGNDAFANTPNDTAASTERDTGNAEIDALQEQLTLLRKESSLLKQQITRLYQLTGHDLDTGDE